MLSTASIILLNVDWHHLFLLDFILNYDLRKMYLNELDYAILVFLLLNATDWTLSLHLLGQGRLEFGHLSRHLPAWPPE
jgi:hypothetical protein